MSILQMPHIMRAIARRSNVLRLPYSLDFSALPDGAVPGWLGSGVVSGGVASVVPTAGPELVVNGNMETGDPPGDWSAIQSAALSAVADERTGGSGAQSINVARNGLNTPACSQTLVTVAGTWYVLDGWSRRVEAGVSVSVTLRDTGGTYITGIPYHTSATWTRQILTARALSNTTAVRGIAAPSVDGESGRFDDISVKPLTLSSLFSGPALRLGRQDVRVSAAWTGTAGTQAGVAIIGDGCGIVAYHDGTNLRLDKWTTPTTWTSLINVAVAYGAGHEVALMRSGTTVQAWYNGVQVGGDQTVTDQNILDARHVALFSTYDGNTASQFNVEAI
jgi:hypothetical protein